MKRASAIAAFVPAVLLGCSHQGAGSASRVPVTVAHAEQRPVPYEILATGTVEPRQTASVQAQVTGVLTRVAFREGDDVAGPDLGPYWAAARPRRESGTGECGGPPRRDPPAASYPGAVRGPGAIPRRYPTLPPEPAAGVREPVEDGHRVPGVPAHVRGQQRRHDHRHGVAQG